jgi:hypothetical protein
MFSVMKCIMRCLVYESCDYFGVLLPWDEVYLSGAGTMQGNEISGESNAST